MSIRDPNIIDPDNIIYQIRSKLDQFRLLNPLEYFEIFKCLPLIIDPDVLAGAELGKRGYHGRTIIIQYKDDKLINAIREPMIHNLSISNCKTNAEETTRIVVYHNHDPESASTQYELRLTIEWKRNYPNASMTVDYFLNSLLSKFSPKLKYQKDKCFKKVIDILKSK